MTESTQPARIASTAEIRAQFPALERVHNGFPVAYFDGPGGTQVPRTVVAAMNDYLFHHNANTHWAYPTSEETDALIEDARAALADFLNADATEIVFGANATTLAYHVSRTLGRQLGAGDEIVVTELDHHANVAPWHALEVERDVTVRVVQLDTETGQLDWNDFEQSVNARTRLIAVGAASNALGTLSDVQRARSSADSVGALLFVDAVHSAPHVLTDVRALACDFLVCSAYKFYGPHVGVLYTRREMLDALDFPKLIPAPDYAPERAETGTQNHEGMLGAAAAVEFLASLAAGATRRARLQNAYAELHRRAARQIEQMWKGLSEIAGVRLYGPTPGVPRTPTVAFTVRDVASTEVARQLAARGLFCSHGDFYAATVIERFDLVPEGFVRAGCACYTTDEEIARLVEAIREIAARR